MRLILLTLLLHASVALAETVTVEWRPNTAPHLGGYRVYVGTSPGTYTTSNDVGTVTTTTLNLATGMVHFIAVTAYDIGGLESDLSDEVRWPGPQQAVDGLAARRLPGVTNALVLSWRHSEEATTYAVRVGTNAGSSYTRLEFTNNYAVISPLTYGVAYYFTVAPVAQNAEGPLSAELARIFRWPAAPSGLQHRRP